MRGYLSRLYSNSGLISKFVIAIVMDVQTNIHTGWTSPTGIITDVLAFAVWLVPNVSSGGASAANVSPVPPSMQSSAVPPQG